MDFGGGPTSGQQAERLQSRIGWLRTEFLGRVNEYLTPPQLAAWSDYRSTAATATASVETAKAPPPQQTQYVRINNNRFTAEEFDYRGGAGTFQGNFGNDNFGNFGNFGGGGGGRNGDNQAEVIEPGCACAWHGT